MNDQIKRRERQMCRIIFFVTVACIFVPDWWGAIFGWATFSAGCLLGHLGGMNHAQRFGFGDDGKTPGGGGTVHIFTHADTGKSAGGTKTT